MRKEIIRLAVLGTLLLLIAGMLGPAQHASGADAIVVKWDNSDVHDIYYMYSTGDQAIWNTTLDNHGATREYTNVAFSDAYFENTIAAIIPQFNTGTTITQAEATAVKDFVDSGGRVLLCGYYDKRYWNWDGQNLVAEKFGVEFVVNEGTASNYTNTEDDISNYGGKSYAPKVQNFEEHAITENVTEWYVSGPSLKVTNSKVKVLARGVTTAYYNSSATSVWINGTDIIHMVVLENDKGGGIIISAGSYILRNDYTAQHGIDNNYNGSKIVDNIAKWLVKGFPVEDEDSPGFEAIIALLVFVPLVVNVIRRRRN